MKIQVASDIHFEMFRLRDDLNDFCERLTGGVRKSASILCIAGDLGVFHRPETWAEPLRALAKRYEAVVCTAGNHEYYNNSVFGQEKTLLAVSGLPTNVHYLLNDSVTLKGVRFIGGTLWTSFYGGNPVAMEHARSRMNDFRLILDEDGSRLTPLTPVQTVRFHESCKSYLFGEVSAARSRNEKTVVVTHHCISPQSVAQQYRGDLLNAAFYTDLEEEIVRNGPDLWIHGHTHHSFDYTLGSTKVICNPFGYLRREENPDFKYRLRIEL